MSAQIYYSLKQIPDREGHFFEFWIVNAFDQENWSINPFWSYTEFQNEPDF